MTRLNPIDPSEAIGKVKDLLEDARKRFGAVPNIIRTLAHSPAALEAYLSFGGSLARGTLSPPLREQIALVVSQINGCGYCLSAHTTAARRVGLTDTDIQEARRANSRDLKTDAALKFARALVLQRGDASNEDIRQIRQAGFSEAEIVEMVAAVALNIFSNYFNHVARTEVDFPKVDLQLDPSDQAQDISTRCECCPPPNAHSSSKICL